MTTRSRKLIAPAAFVAIALGAGTFEHLMEAQNSLATFQLVEQ